MREVGKVINKSRNIATVEIQETASCAKCGICAFDKAGKMAMEAVDTVGVSEGEYVIIDIPAGNVILSGLLLFIFPLIAFFAGYMIKGIILGAVILIVYLIFLYVYDKRSKTIPKITRVLSNT